MVLFTELLGDNLGNLVNGLAFVHVAAVVSTQTTNQHLSSGLARPSRTSIAPFLSSIHHLFH